VLLRDDFFDDMSKPFVLSITKFSLSHLDGRLMMRLHQHHEILVDIPLRLYAIFFTTLDMIVPVSATKAISSEEGATASAGLIA
jgi:hypothetical protein